MDEDDPMDQDPSPSSSKPKGEDGLDEYDLDNYDEEDAMPGMFLTFFLQSIFSHPVHSLAMGPFSNIKGLTYYRNNEEDPYITLKDVCGALNLGVFPSH